MSLDTRQIAPAFPAPRARVGGRGRRAGKGVQDLISRAGAGRHQFIPQKSTNPAFPKGPQELARESTATVVIMGGAFFGGKTWSLLTDPLEHIGRQDFRAPIFRRTMPDHRRAGGTWDESLKIYPLVGGKSREQPAEWRFPSGAQIRMHHMQHMSDAEAWKRGSQMSRCYIDQAEEFEEKMFWALFSRLRSSLGIPPKIMATVNPVPADDPIGGWLNKLVNWWWDPKTGYALRERSGVVRYFYRIDGEAVWYDTEEEAIQTHRELYETTTAAGETRHMRPTSMTFIAATMDDNPIGEALNPEYRSGLNQGTAVEKERGLLGNWLIVDQGGILIQPAWFGGKYVDPGEVPIGGRTIRGWDKAASKQRGNRDSSKTASGLMTMVDGVGELPPRWYIRGSTADYLELHDREGFIVDTADCDGKSVGVRVEQEPAGSGKDMGRITVGRLAGYDAAAVLTRGEDKKQRVTPLAAQCKAGNVYIVRDGGTGWNNDLIAAARVFDGGQPGSDRWDALALAFNELVMNVPIKVTFGTLDAWD